MDRRRRSRVGIPHRQSLVQDLRGNFRDVATFDGSTHLTVNKTQTITGEYKTFYKGKVIATPNESGSEVLYSFVGAFFFLNVTGELKILGNGAPSTVLFDGIDTAQVHEIELELKEGGLRCTLDGVSEEIAVTWSVLTWNVFYFGANLGVDRFYTGKMWDISDHDEFWSLNGTLNGSLGNDAVLTGNNLFTEKYCPDVSPKSMYGSFDGNGYVNFPTQFNLSHSDTWELELDIDVDENRARQHIMGDNETTTDRLTIEPTAMELSFSNGSFVFWSGVTAQGQGRTIVKLVNDGNGNVELFTGGISKGVRTSTDTSITLDNLGRGFTSGGSFGFAGKSYRTTLLVNGDKVLNLVPIAGGKFRDTASQSIVPIAEADRVIFTNVGTDFINYARPTWAVDNLRPTVDEFIVEAWFRGTTGTILSFGAGDISSERQLQFYLHDSRIKIRVGGITAETDQLDASFFETPHHVKVVVSVGSAELYVDGESKDVVNLTSNSVRGENLFIGGRTNGSAYNFDGQTWDVKFSKGDGTLLEHFPLDGSPDGVNGTVGTITDDHPVGVWDFGLINHTDITPSGTGATTKRDPSFYALAKVAPDVVAVGQSVAPIAEAYVPVATVANDEQLESDLYLGQDSQTGLDDWEVEFFDFCIKKIGQQNAHSILFRQYKSGFANKIRVLIKSNGTLVFQNWGEDFDMGYTFTEGVVCENLRIFKVGKQVTIYVNNQFVKTFEVRSEVTTDLDTFKIGTWYSQDSIFCFSKLRINTEIFTIDQGTGNTFTGTEGSQFVRNIGGSGSSLFEDFGLSSEDTDKVVATFDGASYLTVDKSQTITSEYKTFYKGTVLAPPDEPVEEPLYSFLSAFFYLNPVGELKIVGNGAPSTTLFSDIDTAQVHEIELELKEGGLRCTLDGVIKEIAVTWSVATWPEFSIGAHGGIHRFYTGKMWDVSDHEESWPLNGNLNGSLGNDAVLTGNDVYVGGLLDGSLASFNDNTLFTEGIAYVVNVNPTGSALLPYADEFMIREALAGEHTGIAIFTPPNDGRGFKSLVYPSNINLSENEKRKANSKVRQ